MESKGIYQEIYQRFSQFLIKNQLLRPTSQEIQQLLDDVNTVLMVLEFNEIGDADVAVSISGERFKYNWKDEVWEIRGTDDVWSRDYDMQRYEMVEGVAKLYSMAANSMQLLAHHDACSEAHALRMITKLQDRAFDLRSLRRIEDVLSIARTYWSYYDV